MRYLFISLLIITFCFSSTYSSTHREDVNCSNKILILFFLSGSFDTNAVKDIIEYPVKKDVLVVRAVICADLTTEI